MEYEESDVSGGRGWERVKKQQLFLSFPFTSPTYYSQNNEPPAFTQSARGWKSLVLLLVFYFCSDFA